MADLKYAPWPLEGEAAPTDPDVVLYTPMHRWPALEIEPTPEMIARAEEIEGTTYAKATASAKAKSFAAQHAQEGAERDAADLAALQQQQAQQQAAESREASA